MTFHSDNPAAFETPSPVAEMPIDGDGDGDSAPTALGGIDLDELAERVYQRWLDELRLERERSGTQW